MAKIRTYTGGNVGARNLMEVPAGPHATAEAFGAGRARDLYNLGQAVENVGGEVLRIAEIRAKRADDAMIRTLDTEAGD
ncbi:MAG: hypothetical protein LBT97_03855, partial [Planctomycetota bacterium]|nr:hypothetical protein [Planctomycetota bacterium]